MAALRFAPYASATKDDALPVIPSHLSEERNITGEECVVHWLISCNIPSKRTCEILLSIFFQQFFWYKKSIIIVICPNVLMKEGDVREIGVFMRTSSILDLK